MTEIRVRAAKYIDAIQVVYGETSAPTHGGKGGQEHTFQLDDDERIVRIEGRGAKYIDQLQFFTNKGDFFQHFDFPALFSDIGYYTGRNSPVYGGSGGKPFSWFPPKGYNFKYFSGRR